ncbi:MAG TPA: hypothetical protein VGB97_01050 [Candidatus Paceibacterota bacterium]
MYLTIHGVERIQGRTQMLIKDVLSLIENKKVVELGTDGRFDYLLFYSAPDRSCKIAVVTKDRVKLVSVWHRYFRFPIGICLTKEKEAEARILAVSRTLRAEIHVYKDGSEEFVLKAGTINVQRGLHEITALAAVASQMQALVDVVEENRSRIKGRVKYRIYMFDGDNVRFNYEFRHSTAVRLLAASKT